ncbi:MAG: sugar phosphate nucleotidyltransferase [Candidatus Hydrothermarchaeales archaeon]
MAVKGVILAGGHGKRLRPLTEKTPKVLLEIRDGYSILEKQLMDFKHADINDVYLLIGYLGEQIEEKFGRTFNDMKLHYIKEDEPRGTLWALNNALKRIDCDVVVRNGDVVTDLNIVELVKVAQKGDDLIYIAVTEMQSPFGIVEFQDRKITSFKEKPYLGLFINAGIYYIKKGAFEYFKQSYDKKEIEQTVFPKLADERKAGVYREEGAFWRSVDSIKDLEVVRDEYANKNDKPWGYEKIIVDNEKYLVKELYLKKGFRTSMHYHPKKDESMHILGGEGYIEYAGDGKSKETASKGRVIRIKPNIKHSIVATENLRIFEYSTPHPEDTVRVKDFYGRE